MSGKTRSCPLRFPKLINLRSDPFERAEKIGIGYSKWRVDRAFLLVPAQQFVGQYISTFKEFPPSQKVGSFSLDQVLENLTAASTSGSVTVHAASAAELGCRSSRVARARPRSRESNFMIRRSDGLGTGSARLTPVVAGRGSRFLRAVSVPAALDNLDDYRARWQDDSRRRADFHLFWPAASYKEGGRILVAGCGTSQAAEACAALAERAGHGHRLQRDERALHRRTQTQARPGQSRGAATADRARRRAREDIRPRRLHGRPAPSRGSGRCPARVARRARAPWRAPPHGVRALRQGRRLHASGILPAGRSACLGRRHTPAHRRARGVTGEASARAPAARRSGLPARGRISRRAAAPARPRLQRAAAVRVPGRRGAALWPVGETSALQPALWPDGAPAASGAHRRAGAAGASALRRSSFAAR